MAASPGWWRVSAATRALFCLWSGFIGIPLKGTNACPPMRGLNVRGNCRPGPTLNCYERSNEPPDVKQTRQDLQAGSDGTKSDLVLYARGPDCAQRRVNLLLTKLRGVATGWT